MRQEAEADDDEAGETEGDLDSDAKRVLSNIRAIARRRRTAPALGGGGGGSLAVEAQGQGFGMHAGGSRNRFPAKANSSVRVDVKRG